MEKIASLSNFEEGSIRYPMTVVIATLGGTCLKSTIESLNKGSIIPEEILICIPIEEAKKIEDINFPNVKTLLTQCKGQVAQRAIGFQNASHKIVMQLDDDLQLDVNCINYLLKTLITNGPEVAVAPSLMNRATEKSFYKRQNRFLLLQRFCYWIINGKNGYQPGKIGKSGLAMGIDPEHESKSLFEVEWIAGGCVLHYKKNLVLSNFYPFPGKAYCEDILHSYHLGQSKIKLIVNSDAECWLEPAIRDYGSLEFLRELRADFRARKYAMTLFSRYSLRMYIYYIARYIYFLYLKVVM
ncbi:MAG: glycosyltransferase [Legionella sp.]|nr:MAG: glycosyltransferase [Legionella sp.]